MKKKYFCPTCGYVEEVEFNYSWWMVLVVLILGVPGSMVLDWWVSIK